MIVTAKKKVLARFPTASCFKGGSPTYQIWVKSKLFSFAGDKLGSGSTRRAAWEDAERRTQMYEVRRTI